MQNFLSHLSKILLDQVNERYLELETEVDCLIKNLLSAERSQFTYELKYAPT